MISSPEEAESVSEQLLEKMRSTKDPPNDRVECELIEQELLFKSDEAYRRGLYAEALACAWRALDMNPNSWAAYHNLGAVYRLFGEELHKPYMGKISSFTGNAGTDFLRILGRWQKYYRRAFKMYKKAIEINDKSAMTWHEIGVMHYHFGELNEAKSALIKAIKLDPAGAIGIMAKKILRRLNKGANMY